jgi:hyperosmotically inducible protein
MKRIITLMLILAFIAVNSGCGTIIYQAVVDERNVKTIVADTAIKAKIVKRFVDDEIIKALDISVSSYNGEAFLIGEYAHEIQKDRAIKLAKEVEGVNRVTHYFLKKVEDGPCGFKENLALTGKVKAKLVGDKNIWSTNIDVKTMQCTVVLWGLVGSNTEVKKAIAHAKSVKGVKRVKSFLKVGK